MKSIVSLILALLFFATSVLVALNFEAVLDFFVVKMGLGWVYSSIFIRIIVTFLFIVGLDALFKVFKKTRSFRKRMAVLIGIVPGFFISFIIFPIYDIDYGLLDDNRQLKFFAELSDDTNKSYVHAENYELIAFLDVGCGHCEKALKKINSNFAAGQTIPVHLFFHNDTSDVNHFLEVNQSSHLNHHFMLSEGLFVKHAGIEFPSIYLINPKGETVYHWIGEKMNYTALDYLLSLEQ